MSNENGAKEYLKVVREIIEHELDLAPPSGDADASKCRVFIYNQNFVLPTYDDMFIVIQDIPRSVIANNTSYDGSGASLVETQEMIVAKELSIDVLSATKKSDGYCEARDRKEEVLMALNSTYSQQQQEANGFRVFPQFVQFMDSSSAEAPSLLSRYTAKVIVHCKYTVTRTVGSYISIPINTSHN